ncbi:MAG: hypothetical protein U0361_14705 [Nitrospiraceae bacterium]
MGTSGKRMAGAWIFAGVLVLSGCGYNDLQGLDEDAKAAWSEVINQYQRRADLIPESRQHGEGLCGA